MDSPAQPLLSPCVLVVKTPVASRERIVSRLTQATAGLAEEVQAAAREQERTLVAVDEALGKSRIELLRFSVDALGPEAERALAEARLVITVGGDGTLLAASQWVTGAAMLGVNSAPGSSVGHLALSRRADFAATLERIADGTLRPIPVLRLDVELDGQLLRPALNDVLLTHASPAATSRYRLATAGHSEEHRSSGLWVSTPTGSTAGIRSAGGRAMSVRSRRLQFRARELYREAGGTFHLASGFLPPGGDLAVESHMEQGFLYLDGARRQFPFPFGARALFRAAPEPLRLFADPRRWTAG